VSCELRSALKPVEGSSDRRGEAMTGHGNVVARAPAVTGARR
jgi:hypothetical protein